MLPVQLDRQVAEAAAFRQCRVRVSDSPAPGLQEAGDSDCNATCRIRDSANTRARMNRTRGTPAQREQTATDEQKSEVPGADATHPNCISM